MKSNMDKITLESREEISLLQNVLEKAIETNTLTSDEKKVAEKAFDLLDGMWYSW